MQATLDNVSVMTKRKPKSKGRPSKLTPARCKRILEALRAGNTRRASACAGGVDPSTFCNWQNRAIADGEGPYFDFFKQVKEAEAEAERDALSTIRSAAVDSWQAAAWYLERRYPQDYGRKMRHELTTDAPLEVVVEIGGQKK